MEIKSLILISVLTCCCFCTDRFVVKNDEETETSNIECPPSDTYCEQDRIGYSAIQQLHLQIDDDNDGSLDRSESDEFLRDELKYTDGFERHSAFHGHDDLISVNDLWHLWVKSEVYNWTADDVIDWLTGHVELPQYEHNFKVNAVDGRMLPRIAANTQYLTSILGIKNAVHKQKLVLKAMDTVLFGAPKHIHNWIKDVALVASLLVAVGGFWLAYVQNKYSQTHLKKVMKDLDTLQKAEESLLNLQKKLETAEKDQIDVIEEKRTLERKYESEINDAKLEADKLKSVREVTLEEVQRLKIAEQELDQVRRALRKAEKELEDRQNAPLAELQQWLQVTYEIESKHFDTKKEAVEKHLIEAKEMCEKIRKKKGAFLGSLRVAHTTSMDDTDHAIMSAKAALEEIRVDLQERSHRWQEIEKICGFNITMNPGLPFLEQLLGAQSYPGTSSSGINGRGNSAPLGLEDGDEDAPPGYLTATAMSLVPGHANYKGPRQPSGMIPSHPSEKRLATSLTQAYSSSALNASSTPTGGIVGVHPLTAAMQPQRLHHHHTLPTAVQPNPQNSDTSLESEVSRQRVEFSLDGGSSVSAGTYRSQLQDEDLRVRSGSFGRSTSDNTTRLRPTALTLSTSRSETTLSNHVAGSSSTSQRSVLSAGNPPAVEEESSPESAADSSSLTSTEDKATVKKKKKKLLHKLLGKDKSKVS